MTVWSVEGLPGVGKSTLAAHLCDLARESGHEAVWYVEEAADHPVHPSALKTQRRSGDFITACLQAWGEFAGKCRAEHTIHILEGSAFQSTVRFMMEERMGAIGDYYRRFEEILAPLTTKMVYLRPGDARQHSRYTARFRGREWSDKVSNYLEKSGYSRSRGLHGLNGMHAFWEDYALLCDQLVARTTVPVKLIDFTPGDWDRHLREAADFFGLDNSPAGDLNSSRV